MPILERLPLRRVTLGQALDAMASFPVRRARVETIALANAEGRVLAADVVAREDVPAFRRSRVDGYAVIAEDVRAASRDRPVRLRVVGEVLMGERPAHDISPGQAARVPTGGALPAGATGVVMVEDTELHSETIAVFDGSDTEEFVSDIASDVRADSLLFAAGTVLSPAALGLACGAGVSELQVYVPPRVGVIVTGDELVAAQHILRPGQIRDINGVVLPSALRAMGFDPMDFGRVADERDALAATFGRALSECDAVVISGGSSVGERDYTPEVVAAAGVPGVIVHGIKAKPGRPALLAMIGEQPVFGLPGNPVSALTVLEAAVKPVLLRMFDKTDETPPVRAQLQRAVDVEAHLEHRIPVRLTRAGDLVVAAPLLGTSAQMHILGFADGMLVVPLGTARIAAGSWVDVIPFSRTRTLR